MKLENIDVKETIEKAKASIKNDKNISSTTKTVFELLVVLITILVNRLNLNSSNSSKPPSTDKDKKKRKSATNLIISQGDRKVIKALL